MLCLSLILDHKFQTLVLEYPCAAYFNVFADLNRPISSKSLNLKLTKFYFAGSAQEQTEMNVGKFL